MKTTEQQITRYQARIRVDDVAQNILLGMMVLCCIGQFVMMFLIVTGLWQPSCLNHK